VRTTLRIVEAAGTPRQLGQAHGEDARELIARGLEAWSGVIGRQTGMPAAAYVESFLRATDFVPAIGEFTPALLEEVRGIAEGAAQPFDAIFAYQLIDEEWAYRARLVRGGRGQAEACSAAGVLRADGTAVAGQNMDLPSHYDGTQVLLRTRTRDGADVMVFTPAGVIGTTGLNQHGVGVCVNTLSELRHSSTGLPVAFVMRGALAQRSARDAAGLLRTVPHATGQNYIVADAGRVEDYECSPGEVAEVPADGAQVLHTNHVLMSGDIDREVTPESRSTTVQRLDALRSELSDLRDGATAADLRRVLATRPVCVVRGSEWMTLGSVVMELGREPVVHVALGPPADTQYSRVTFRP
jgi:predicted choloylglycine hydrolase